MNDNLDEFIRKTSDGYLYEMFLAIFRRLFSDDSVITQILILAKKHGMPVKNIMPFIQDLGEWCKNHSLTDSQILSNEDSQAVRVLLSRSGFMTIGFTQEGDDSDGN